MIRIVQQTVYVDVANETVTTSNSGGVPKVTWADAGRRAVEKHADALRRLSDED